MLTVKIVDGQVKPKGKVEAGDVYPDVHCAGFGWLVTVVFDAVGEPDYWGSCQNPNCPNVCGCGEPECYFNGTGEIGQEDLIELLGRKAGAEKGVQR